MFIKVSLVTKLALFQLLCFVGNHFLFLKHSSNQTWDDALKAGLVRKKETLKCVFVKTA